MGIDDLPGYDKKCCTLFALGRNAMYAICQMLNLKSGDEVLTPAYDCDGSKQPFKVFGLSMKLYRSDGHTFSVDLDDIKRKITSQTRLLHIINHFGMPQPWDDLLSLKKKYNIPILEDNAFSLFSTYKGDHFGTFGDMSIFSLRKMLPLPDGGMLRVNNSDYTLNLEHKNPKWLYPPERKEFLRIMKKKSERVIPPRLLKPIARLADRYSFRPPPLYSDKEKGYPDWPARDKIHEDFSYDFLRPMSRLSRYYLDKFTEDDYRDVIAKIRYFYSLALQRSGNIQGITPLWPDLPEGIVPFCLFFLIRNKRDLLLEKLRKKYDFFAWPTYPGFVLEQMESFPEVELLGRSLLQLKLPIDKVRRPDFMRYLEDALGDLEKLSREYQ